MVSLLEEAKDSGLVRRRIEKETIPNEGQHCNLRMGCLYKKRDSIMHGLWLLFLAYLYIRRDYGVRSPAFLPTAGVIQRHFIILLEIHVDMGSALFQSVHVKPAGGEIQPPLPEYRHDMQDEAIHNTAGLS